MAGWIVRLIGVLLMLTALGVALSRAPDRPVETLVARWAPPPSDFVELKGMVVHLRDEGPRDDERPIVLIHGTSASLHTWEGWVRQLKTQRRVISFDLPGFGLTGPFAGQYAAGNYHGDTYARFVIDLLNLLQLQRVVIAGNSLGGEVAWRTAVMAPERVAGLVLVDAVGPPFKAGPPPVAWQVLQLPVLNRVGEWLLPRSFIAEGLHQVYGDPSKVTTELVERYFELTLREGNRRALGERLRQVRPGDNAERIDTVRQPTLILWGGRDRLIPPSVGEDFERRIKGSQRVVFDELGHVPQEEDPVRSLAPVKIFLGLR